MQELKHIDPNRRSVMFDYALESRIDNHKETKRVIKEFKTGKQVRLLV